MATGLGEVAGAQQLSGIISSTGGKETELDIMLSSGGASAKLSSTRSGACADKGDVSAPPARREGTGAEL